MQAFYPGLTELREESTITIPIKKLIHVTHSTEVADISTQNPDLYTFKPKEKFGKNYGDNPGSCTPNENGEFDQVFINECVFCGNQRCTNCKFSWWGIDISNWYKTDDTRGKLFGEAVKLLVNDGAYVSTFFLNPPESPYGTKGFSADFSTLIRAYDESRNDSDGKVCFRVGGTLEYRQEIAYVVIVCKKTDSELDNFPPIDHRNAIFTHQGLNDTGEIEDDQKIPSFNFKYFVKSKYPNKREFDWENLVFGFYLPNGKHLKCNQRDIGPPCSVTHNHVYCHKKCERFVMHCPDYDPQRNDSCNPIQLPLCKVIKREKPCGKFFCPEHH